MLRTETKKEILLKLAKKMAEQGKDNISKVSLNKIFISKLMGREFGFKEDTRLIFYNRQESKIEIPIPKSHLDDCHLDVLYISKIFPQPLKVGRAKRFKSWEIKEVNGYISDYIKFYRENEKFIIEFLNPERELGIVYTSIFHPVVTYYKFIFAPEEFKLTDKDFQVFKEKMEEYGVIKRNYIDIKRGCYKVGAKEIRKNGKFIKGYIYSSLYPTTDPEYSPEYFIRVDKIWSVEYDEDKRNCCGDMSSWEELNVVYEKNGKIEKLVASSSFYYSVATGTKITEAEIVGVCISFDSEKEFYEAIEWHRENLNCH